MNRNGIQTYALTVCLLCIAVILFFGGYAINNLIQYLSPEFTISNAQVRRHSSNELYEEYLIKMARMAGVDGRLVVSANTEMGMVAGTDQSVNGSSGEYVPLSQEELTQKRSDSWAFEVHSEKRNGLKGFVRESVTILISVFILLLHWRVANRQKQSPDDTSGAPQSGGDS